MGGVLTVVGVVFGDGVERLKGGPLAVPRNFHDHYLNPIHRKDLKVSRGRFYKILFALRVALLSGVDNVTVQVGVFYENGRPVESTDQFRFLTRGRATNSTGVYDDVRVFSNGYARSYILSFSCKRPHPCHWTLIWKYVNTRRRGTAHAGARVGSFLLERGGRSSLGPGRVGAVPR